MPVTLSDLEAAFLASDPRRGASSWIHEQTSEVRMSFDENEGGGPPPEDETGWHLMPDAHELNLTHDMVWDFVIAECPERLDEIRRIFSQRGAWRMYKDFLAQRNLLDRWHQHKDAATCRALLAWAARQGMAVVNVPPKIG